jgi:hypothetical protein
MRVDAHGDWKLDGLRAFEINTETSTPDEAMMPQANSPERVIEMAEHGNDPARSWRLQLWREIDDCLQGEEQLLQGFGLFAAPPMPEGTKERREAAPT